VLRPSYASAVGMKAISEVLFVQWQTVCRMTFEVFPDVLNGIEFGSIFWKIFNVEPRVLFAELPNVRPLVDSSMVP